jgi:hypothetical protein
MIFARLIRKLHFLENLIDRETDGWGPLVSRSHLPVREKQGRGRAEVWPAFSRRR